MWDVMASWRNGYAEDCKSLYPSSILGDASKLIRDNPKSLISNADWFSKFFHYLIYSYIELM